MDIRKLISNNLIKVGIDCNNKEEMIKELAELINENGKLNSFETYLEDVFKRERDYSTGIGMGIAIPHGKSKGVKNACIAIGKCKEIDWNSMDGKPVKLVFLLAVPAHEANTEHLMILAKLAELMMDENFVEEILSLESSSEIYNFLINQKALL